MEPVGLALGIAGLTGVFNSCVNCFEYIQLGRSFGNDYGKCLLRLDAAKIRMTRWGAAVGIEGGKQSLNQIAASEREIRFAQDLLEQIIENFDDAAKKSAKYKSNVMMKDQDNNGLVLYNADSDLDARHERLHLTMRELARKRQKKLGFVKKTRWALYEKKRFDTMIEDISDLVGKLIELFPASLENQKALCKAEVSAFKHPEDLKLLNNVASEDDKILEEAVKEEIGARGHTYTDWKVDDSRMWAGDDNAAGVASKSHHFSKFTVSCKAYVRLGNTNRGN